MPRTHQRHNPKLPETSRDILEIEDLLERILPSPEEDQAQALLQFMEFIYQVASKEGFSGIENITYPVNRRIYSQTSHYSEGVRRFIEPASQLAVAVAS